MFNSLISAGCKSEIVDNYWKVQISVEIIRRNARWNRTIIWPCRVRQALANRWIIFLILVMQGSIVNPELVKE